MISEFHERILLRCGEHFFEWLAFVHRFRGAFGDVGKLRAVRVLDLQVHP